METTRKVGDKIQLKNQEVEVCACKECEHLMVNIDKDETAQGDLSTLKAAGVRISNPETEDEVCLNCEVRTLGRRIADWFDSDDNDDSWVFTPSVTSHRPSYTPPSSSGFGGFSGGFGGFGGGGFGGGGISRGF